MSRSDDRGLSNSPNGDSADAPIVNRDLLEAFADLTAFQRDTLWTLFHEDDHEAYGLRIKSQLEAMYGGEVNHGRLYPNLDTLVEAGLIEKGEIDKRTNSYTLTDEATTLLAERQAWERGEY